MPTSAPASHKNLLLDVRMDYASTARFFHLRRALKESSLLHVLGHLYLGFANESHLPITKTHRYRCLWLETWIVCPGIPALKTRR